MPIRTLFESGPQRYGAEEADGPGVLWFFVHVPKTAGSSFRSEMVELLEPSFNLRVDARDPGLTQEQRRQQALDELIEESRTMGLRFASGHVPFAEALRLRKVNKATKFITMLREPVARVVSQYRYFRSPDNPGYQKVIEHYPDFDSFLDDEINADVQFKRLAPDPQAPVAEAIHAMEEEYAFIGLLEHYNYSFGVLTHLLGEARRPEVHKRKTQDTKDNAVELSEDVLRKVRRLNRRDMEVFRHFRQRYAGLVRQQRAAAGPRSR